MQQEENLHGIIQTTLHAEEVAALYRCAGWHVRQVDEWVAHEVSNGNCAVTIESFPRDMPLYMHGVIHGTAEDMLKHTDEMLSHLRQAGLSFGAWCYPVPSFEPQEFLHNYEGPPYIE